MTTAIITPGAQSATTSRPGFFDRLKESFAIWRGNRSRKRTAAHMQEIINRFDIAERAGRLFIVCDGVAISEVKGTAPATEIIKQLETARQAGCQYAKINL